ncbi:hypothetical protein CALVIDRAFT_136372 [Calocera viscosa TUFC12733]|uniref:F-box domain-containing protein n=1 Tax=Calocera viscosa (strain TUFC12733) TaxID=1330018 RepID=A0A167LYD9_CALVF|nr:hypothetical protein CALVIDRAFT_136372 [Calocera viscosa TUFC12733]
MTRRTKPESAMSKVSKPNSFLHVNTEGQDSFGSNPYRVLLARRVNPEGHDSFGINPYQCHFSRVLLHAEPSFVRVSHQLGVNASHMHSAPSTKLKQDVWRYVFEAIVDEARSPDVVLPLLFVCKQWKAIAEPLLYRHLVFHRPVYIERCHRTLVQQSIRHIYHGNATRSLTLRGNTAWHNNTTGIERLLRYTSRLSRFSCRHFAVGTNVLDMLSQTCGRSLQELDITIGTDATLQMALLNRFTSLGHLGINVLHMAQIHSMDTPALDMPSMETLALSCYTDEALSSLVHFLCRGSFVALQFLSLTDILGGQPCQLVLPLLEKFGHQLSTVTLCLPSGEDVARLLFSSLKTVKQIYLINTLPDDIGCFLPSSVVMLELRLDLQEKPKTQDLLQFLDDLRRKKRQTHALGVVQLHSWATQAPFHWSTFGILYPTLAGHLMTRSVGLQLKGIKLLDEDGKCLMLG